MKFKLFEDIVSLTDEQREILARYWRLTHRPYIEAMRFNDGIKKLQSMAGHSQEQIGEISQALLDMANQENN